MRRLIFIIGMMLLVTPLSFAQNGHDLFQKALQKERAEGNLEAAIALYARIVEEHASDRALVAKALLQMGQDYERLDRTEEAQRVKLMPAVGGEPRELLHLKGSEQIVNNWIAWTADGQDVLFAKRSGTSVEEQNIELWRISVDGGAPSRLGALAMEGLDQVRVHPDGRRIAFTAGPDKYEVWVMENYLPEDEGTQ